MHVTGGKGMLWPVELSSTFDNSWRLPAADFGVRVVSASCLSSFSRTWTGTEACARCTGTRWMRSGLGQFEKNVSFIPSLSERAILFAWCQCGYYIRQRRLVTERTDLLLSKADKYSCRHQTPRCRQAAIVGYPCLATTWPKAALMY